MTTGESSGLPGDTSTSQPDVDTRPTTLLSTEPVPSPDESARSRTKAMLGSGVLPAGALGNLEELATWAAAVQGTAPPEPFADPRLVVIAGDHEAGQTQTEFELGRSSADGVMALESGAAPASALAAQSGLSPTVAAVSLDVSADEHRLPVGGSQYHIRRSSGPIDRQDAQSRVETDEAWELGEKLADRFIDEGADLLILGHLGTAGTIAAAAVIARLTGRDPYDVCGQSAGIDDITWMRRVEFLRDALWRTIDMPTDPRSVLRSLGGADLAAIAGFLAQSSRRGTPTILDGPVVAAAAALAEGAVPAAKAWWLAGDLSPEPGHRIALEELDLVPVLNLHMSLGQGSASLITLTILQSAIGIADEVSATQSSL